jgi:hypothetical protein
MDKISGGENHVSPRKKKKKLAGTDIYLLPLNSN